MRAAFSAFRLFHTLAKSRIESFRDRTSSTTVFMLPPFHIQIEIRQQFVNIDKRIRPLALAIMPVIPFS